MDSGIYIIKNIINNKCYIGSTSHINQRKKEHFSRLYNQTHHNIHLQNSYNKYGKDAFIFEIIEVVDYKNGGKLTLLDREQYYINILKPEYNILQIAGSTLGYNHSEEIKDQISKSLLGVKKSKIHAQHIKECQKGKTLSEEHKHKLSIAAKNRKINGHKTKIEINGTKYNSLKEASELLQIKYNTLQQRLKNPRFENYKYVNIKL